MLSKISQIEVSTHMVKCSSNIMETDQDTTTWMHDLQQSIILYYQSLLK